MEPKEKIRVEVQNEKNVHGGAVNEDIEGVMTNTDIEQTGGNKEDKVGKEHNEGIMTDTEIKQIGGSKVDNIGRDKR